MRELKDIITESFNKEYGYRIKLARDCTAEDLTKLENALQKYNLVSATPWKRLPIQENPLEFQRLKGMRLRHSRWRTVQDKKGNNYEQRKTNPQAQKGDTGAFSVLAGT